MIYALTRLLRTENDWSDWLCLLAELDPEPLRSALRLPQGAITLEREVVVAAGKGARAGRVDLIVYLDGIEVSMMEVKLGAGAHGDQFAVYDAWADAKELPVSARHLVGPSLDPIPNEPTHWSRRLTIPALVAAWTQSPDEVARRLSALALQQFTQLEAEAAGPANAVSTALSDALRLRRLASRSQATAPPGTVFEPTQRSGVGGANICAWRETADGWVVAEIQRLNPRSPNSGIGTPFEIRIMVGIPDGTPDADGELADRHREWLARRSFVRWAGATVPAMVVAPDDDGFKPTKPRSGRGHPRYYGYKGCGQGSSVRLRGSADLNDMVSVFSSALGYLATYPEQ
ncbi:hypothetical protein B4N89_45290 [Embleya scabrispora]|uniref:Uncharacterized protein n=1 Tax=Embleya scabrispora TaxID=159449 RepID=A0A1T3NIQ1_9ACTN|nr:hypothetical protein [Embleya scabrispora]OPC76704.1 hypothetical protein B4N89_45290 [Embleya scabrispora]